LTLGITCALVIFLVERFELSFDRFHSKADRIFRIKTDTITPETIYHSSGSSFPIGPAVKSEMALIKNVTVVNYVAQGLVSIPQTGGDSKKFNEPNGVAFVDPDFFDLFDFSWRIGGPELLAEPGRVVLSEAMAEKYFGSSDPLGRIIRLDNSVDLRVVGIVKNFPVHSNFPFKIIVSFSTLKKTAYAPKLEDWRDTNSNTNTFIVIDPGTVEAVERQLRELQKKYVPNYQTDRRCWTLQPLNEIHYDIQYDAFNGHQISRTSLWALAWIGILILLTACFNFVNMATAQALNRMREIGVRKTLGADRVQLIAQFLGETLLITGISAVASFASAEVTLPYLDSFFGIRLSADQLNSADTLLVLSVLVIGVSVMAGLYPAIVLSGFRPVRALKGKLDVSPRPWSLRKALVVGQFVVSQLLIIGTLVVTYQMEFFQTQNMGFKKDAILIVPLPNNDDVTLRKLRAQMLSDAAVENVSFSYNSVSSNNIWTSSFVDFRNGQETRYRAEIKPADVHYLETNGLELLAGRNVIESDTMNEIVANETFTQRLGISSPQDALGHVLKFGKQQLPIVGVVRDFHTQSLHRQVDPCIMGTIRSAYQQANIRINPGNMNRGAEHVAKIWKSIFTEYVYEASFLDQDIQKFYEDDQRTLVLFRVSAAVAIFIGALGLFGLVSFMAERRTKEVGIRKVVGATVFEIIGLFGKEFGWLMGFAFVLSAPAAYYVMNQWLEEFAYRIKIGPEVFVLTLLASFALVAISVGYRSIKAAMTNPVEALKYE